MDWMQIQLQISSTSNLTLIHQSQGLLYPSGRPHLLYRANGRKCDYDTSDICDTGSVSLA